MTQAIFFLDMNADNGIIINKINAEGTKDG